jgi:hypothetical protein
MPQNHVLLETIELSQSAASVTLDNIPQTGYTDLKVVLSLRASASANWALVGINGGSDTATTLRHILDNEGTPITQSYTSLRALLNGSSLTDNTFSSSELYFSDYTSANQKTISGNGAQENNAAGTNRHIAAFLWPFTSAITSLTFTVDGGSSFVAGSTFSIYGVAATGTNPVTAPFASGGNIVANDGTYWYHAFLSSGTFTPDKALTCDYLVIAGGGGGGAHNAGGGGAGGLRSTVTQTGGNSVGVNLETPLSLTSGSIYTVMVGAGGAGGNNFRGAFGNNSLFSTITSQGGAGGGGANSGEVALAGGGSGGGGSQGTNGSAGTTNQGFAGGNSSGNNTGGGGGGAGAAGSANSGTNGGNGGAGIQISAFATPTNTGVSGFYAGGGGGSAFSGSQGSAGSGGATAGSYNGAEDAVRNTGSGAGARNREPGAAGNGASGIVIVRYPMV